MSYLLQVLIALDQLLYALTTLGYDMPDETLSAAAWRTDPAGRRFGKFFRPIIDRLFFFRPALN